MTFREAAFLRFSQTAGGLCLLGSSAMHKERTTDTGLNFSTILRTWGALCPCSISSAVLYSLDYSFLTCDTSLLWMGGKWALRYTVESFMNEIFLFRQK